MPGRHRSMAVSPDLAEWSKKVLGPEVVAALLPSSDMELGEMDSGEVSVERQPSPKEQGLFGCPSDVCDNAGSGKSGVSCGEPPRREATPRQIFSDKGANPWRRPVHIQIECPNEIKALAADGINVTLNLERVRDNVASLEHAIVGKILGKKVSFFLLKTKLERQWGGFGEFQLTTMAAECFICRFSSNEARDAMLCGGPWFIGGCLVGLDRWTPGFSPASMEGLSSPVWIRLPNLPLEYWDECNISRIASRIGLPMWIDAQTDNWGRREYASVCVRMNLANQLLTGIWIEGLNGRFYQKVEYEGIGLLCYGCGRVGHRRDVCPSKPLAQATNLGKKSIDPRDSVVDSNRDRSGGRQSAVNPSELPKPNGFAPVASPSAPESSPSKETGPDHVPDLNPQLEENSEDPVGPWLLVPPRRRKNVNPPLRNKVSNGNLALSKPPKQVDLDKITAPINLTKPTRKQTRMGINQTLLFSAGTKVGVSVTNRFNAGLAFSQGAVDFELPRGAHKKQTGHFLRSLVVSHEVLFVGLLETKIEVISRSDVDVLIGPCWDFVHHPARGTSGGLLALWRRDVVQFDAFRMTDQALVGHLVLPNLQRWCLALVYGGKDYHTRHGLWETLGSSMDADLPVMVGGDFNCCLDQIEKKGGRRFGFPVGAQEMAAFMSSNDLHDLGFTGPKFTWSNNKAGTSKIWVRLDRILMNSSELDLAPLASVKHLIRLASDHCPLLLQLLESLPNRPSKWIRFEDTWRTYPATWKLVWKNWSKPDHGMLADVLNRKCSRTIRALSFWSRNRLQDLGTLRKSLEDRLAELQLIDCSEDGLSAEEDHELRMKACELNATLARMATWWRQRAKTRWIAEGDSNSRFFHSFATARRRGNRIVDILCLNGERTSEPAAIQDEFMNFFSLKWQERCISLEDWPNLRPENLVHDNLKGEMEAEVTELEIRQAIFSMGENRSPGLDGITVSFLKFYWEIIKVDVIRAILHFFESNSMCDSWKDTLVVLIPKVDNANSPSKFRPISLCQSFYKVVAKVLINHLKPCLGIIISEEQGAFVPRRSISNHALVAQEVMHKFQHSLQRAGMMALKIDMEQAYDCMAWDTLRQIMSRMGFPARVIQWVTRCVTRPRFTLMINGNRTPWIAAQCGLRQGCPLSPYLFILFSELLSLAFKLWGGNLGIPLGRNPVNISHLLYADDILVFAEANRCNANRIRSILADYCC
ncbi:uncharacterized protein LOC110092773 [Dendrobium catenatum]|uniref:uncharacterized protein LOC110092773 n=1 Tax=Dendrobium catenatum TaxID=906689 RepID=UPI00109F1DF2|nr:uncharacterized protein LOC110092773 [Dendrobium catenatum]